MKKIYALFVLSLLVRFAFSQTYHPLINQPFIQNWTNTGLITANDNWTGVPAIQGFLGQNITTGTGVNPQTLTGISSFTNDLDVMANLSSTGNTNGGVAEFDGIANPTIALQGSGTADAPHLIVYLNTTGVNSVRIQYNIRDIDTSLDNAIQQVALQYRIGNTGIFTDIPAAYIKDASTGPRLATLVTAVDVMLPEAANNQEQVQLRIITTNAVGSDEWVGIDDINISASKGLSLSSSVNAAEPGTNGLFTFTFAPVTDAVTSFDYSFIQDIGGSARFGVDYSVSYTNSSGTVPVTSREGTLTVPASTGSVIFTVRPIEDELEEGTEYIQLILSNPSAGYTTGTDRGSISLSDNDAASTVSVTAGSQLSEPATDGQFILTLSSPAPSGGVTINYLLSGDASATNDYSDPQSGTINIAEGLTTAILTLKPTDDLLTERQETIIITLNSVTADYVIATGSATIMISDNDFPKIVINEAYGGGGNSGATYKNDYIELYNNSATAIPLTGWSIQYASAAGTTWQKTNLSDTIPANGYYLIQQAAGAGGTTNLPTPDERGTIAMAAAAGKIALVNNTTLLTGACPTGGQIVDFVGFGTANCFEGSAAANAPSNTSSIQRSSNGFDSDNNAADFGNIIPAPKNSVTDITSPVILSTYPQNTEVNIGTAFVVTLTLSEPVEKGSGIIALRKSDGTAVVTFDVTSPNVTVAGNNVSFLVQSLAFNTSYYFEIEQGSFKDADGNAIAATTGNSSWSFTTKNRPVGMIGTTYQFADCNSVLSDGFSFYSVTGAQVWSCTPFGTDASKSATGSAANGVQINGFSGTNIQNEDWLISPSYDLTSSAYPLLSYYNRTRFNGPPLQLKVSTDYPGTGDPRNYSWTDINGKFAAQTSDVWTLASDINLSAYKGTNIHFAFVYHSSEDDGARWTVDDITVINSATPPPPSLTVSASDIQFPYVASGATSEKTFTFTANDLIADVNLEASGDFLLSKDGVAYSTSITYNTAEANNITKTVHLRFAPTAKNENLEGYIFISTSGITDTIHLKGTSIDPATTLEVVNWNIEWFGSKGFGPTNEEQQEQNIKTILKNVNADIYGLVEVVDEARLARVVTQMDGYSYVIGNFGSHVNPPSSTGGPLADAQKLAFVYKTSVFSNVTARALINNQQTSSASYNNWASGRYPFLMNADVTLNCVTKKISFILIHAKANTSPTAISYARRQAAAAELHDTLQTHFADAQVILLGDFNDDLDKTITDGINPPYSSYKMFTDDNSSFFSPTLSLSLSGKKSTVSYNDVIDHVMITNELQPYFMPGTANILTDAAGLVNNYATTTSDHYPVFTRYQFEQPAPPVITTCPVFPPTCLSAEGNYTIPAFQSVSSCGPISYHYAMSGATTRTGDSNDASGAFNQGTSIITWTATDGAGQTTTCTTTVVINKQPVVTIPDAYALNAGVLANTVYAGYAPAASLTLESVITGTPGPYNYSWTPAALNSSAVVVTPSATHTYSLVVTDANGCSATASKTIAVIDVTAGKNGDKVTVCHMGKSLEINTTSVADHLAHRDMLAACAGSSLSAAAANKANEYNSAYQPKLNVRVLPNPSKSQFTLVTRSSRQELVTVTVADAAGRTVEKRTVAANGSFILGSSYRPGVYYALIRQGSTVTRLKLIKQ